MLGVPGSELAAPEDTHPPRPLLRTPVLLSLGCFPWEHLQRQPSTERRRGGRSARVRGGGCKRPPRGPEAFQSRCPTRVCGPSERLSLTARPVDLREAFPPAPARTLGDVELRAAHLPSRCGWRGSVHAEGRVLTPDHHRAGCGCGTAPERGRPPWWRLPVLPSDAPSPLQAGNATTSW